MKKSSSLSNDGFYDIQWRSETHLVVFSIELSSYLSTVHPIILGDPSVEERLMFETEQSKLGELFTDLSGSLIWRDCLSLMKANALNIAGTAKEPSLIAFSMDNCCSELLKNSIDALILRHIASSDAPTKLEVHFKPAIDDGRLKLTVSDNCGGFPTDVIAFYNAALRKENLAEYKAAFRANVSAKNSEVLLGGQGLGLKILGGLIRYGTLMALDDESLEYKMTGVDTCILLSNSSIGAQITLEIPIVPIPKISIAEKLEDCSVEMIFDTESFSTYNKTRDKEVKGGSEWMDVPNFPKVTFKAKGFKVEGNTYVTSGELTMKGISKKIPVKFVFDGKGENNGKEFIIVSGSLGLDMTEFGIPESSEVDKGVEIEFTIEANKME